MGAKKIPFPQDDDDGSTVLVEVKSNDERFCVILTILTNPIEALDHGRALLRCLPDSINDGSQGPACSASGLATIDLCGCGVLHSSLPSSALLMAMSASWCRLANRRATTDSRTTLSRYVRGESCAREEGL